MFILLYLYHNGLSSWFSLNEIEVVLVISPLKLDAKNGRKYVGFFTHPRLKSMKKSNFVLMEDYGL